MAGVERRHRLLHRVQFAVGGFHGDFKSVHIVRHGAFAERNKALRVRKTFHPDGQYAGRVGAVFNLCSDVGSLPFVPVGNVRKLGLPVACDQFAVFGHGPDLAAAFAGQGRAAGRRGELFFALWALIKDLFKTDRSVGAVDLDPVFELPSEIVVLKLVNDPSVDLVDRKGADLLRRDQLFHRRRRGFHAALVTGVPEGVIDMVTVADDRDDRHAERLAELPERFRHGSGRSAERVTRLGVDRRDALVIYDGADVLHDGHIVCEFALADTADIAKQFFAADKAVDRDDVIRHVRKSRARRNLHIEKRVVVTEQDVGRLDALHIDPLDLRSVFPRPGKREHPDDRLQKPLAFFRGQPFVESFELIVHFVPFYNVVLVANGMVLE